MVGASSTGPRTCPSAQHGPKRGSQPLPGHAAQRCCQCRDANLPVAGVGHDNDVGGQPVAVGLQEVAEAWGACLFFTLEEEGDAESELLNLGQDRAQGCDVHHDAGLVVCCTAAVKAAIDFCGLKRFGVPQFFIARWLHIVVGVEQDRWLAIAGRSVCHDGGSAHGTGFGGHPQDVHLFHTGIANQLGHGLGASVQLRRVE